MFLPSLCSSISVDSVIEYELDLDKLLPSQLQLEKGNNIRNAVFYIFVLKHPIPEVHGMKMNCLGYRTLGEGCKNL